MGLAILVRIDIPSLSRCYLSTCRFLGSHVVYALQKTRRYRVVTIDNHNNSHPQALARVVQLSKDALPKDPTELERQSAEIDSYKCDLTKPDEVRLVFDQFGKGGIWGVIHIAVCV